MSNATAFEAVPADRDTVTTIESIVSSQKESQSHNDSIQPVFLRTDTHASVSIRHAEYELAWSKPLHTTNSGMATINFTRGDFLGPVFLSIELPAISNRFTTDNTVYKTIVPNNCNSKVPSSAVEEFELSRQTLLVHGRERVGRDYAAYYPPWSFSRLVDRISFVAKALQPDQHDDVEVCSCTGDFLAIYEELFNTQPLGHQRHLHKEQHRLKQWCKQQSTKTQRIFCGLPFFFCTDPQKPFPLVLVNSGKKFTMQLHIQFHPTRNTVCNGFGPAFERQCMFKKHVPVQTETGWSQEHVFDASQFKVRAFSTELYLDSQALTEYVRNSASTRKVPITQVHRHMAPVGVDGKATVDVDVGVKPLTSICWTSNNSTDADDSTDVDEDMFLESSIHVGKQVYAAPGHSDFYRYMVPSTAAARIPSTQQVLMYSFTNRSPFERAAEGDPVVPHGSLFGSLIGEASLHVQSNLEQVERIKRVAAYSTSVNFLQIRQDGHVSLAYD
ncbi:hypothetical protein OAM67_00780 [bacterium]|nr:hypothetical protein [bacterium]